MTRPGLPGRAGAERRRLFVGKGPRLFGDEGRLLLDEQQAHLFPASVRPAFLRLLWVALAALAIGIAVVIGTIGWRLP